jgi:hypothetical protein
MSFFLFLLSSLFFLACALGTILFRSFTSRIVSFVISNICLDIILVLLDAPSVALVQTVFLMSLWPFLRKSMKMQTSPQGMISEKRFKTGSIPVAIIAVLAGILIVGFGILGGASISQCGATSTARSSTSLYSLFTLFLDDYSIALSIVSLLILVSVIAFSKRLLGIIPADGKAGSR